jgi:hypothetical protein
MISSFKERFMCFCFNSFVTLNPDAVLGHESRSFEVTLIFIVQILELVQATTRRIFGTLIAIVIVSLPMVRNYIATIAHAILLAMSSRFRMVFI